MLYASFGDFTATYVLARVLAAVAVFLVIAFMRHRRKQR